MNGTVIAAFGLTFVLGPLLCAAMLRLRSSLVTLLALAALVVVPMGIALWLETRAPLTSLLLMWLGWVAACAMVGHALLRRLRGRIGRWITLATILATTLPWFGLATARLMS